MYKNSMLKVYDASAVLGMRKAGQIACLVLDAVETYLQTNSNISSLDIERLCDSEIRKHGAIPECIGYESLTGCKYLYASCISPNEIICHGVPNQYIFKQGDIVNVDIVVRFGEWLGDTSRTFKIGKVSTEDELLVSAAKGAMYSGMGVVQIGTPFSLVGGIISKYIRNFNRKYKTNFSIVPGLCSHGISKTMHEEPSILHTPNNASDRMQPYHFFTIEPIIAAKKEIRFYEDKNDKWSIISNPPVKTAQFEHTVTIDQNNQLLILTSRDLDHEIEILSDVKESTNKLLANP